MSLHLSQDERTEIVRRWFDRIIGRYPVETARFLRDQRDRFANPVGAGLRQELAPILDVILAGEDPRTVEPSLDRIVRVRALQDMPPSEAVSFVLMLKELVGDAVDPGADAAAVREFERRVDEMLVVTFDVYSRCREQVFEIRVKEIRNRSLKVMERLNSWRENRTLGPATDA